jgi:hypothetical protein
VVSELAVPVSEAGVKLVEALIHGVEDELQEWIHGASSSLKPGKVGMVQIDDSLIPIVRSRSRSEGLG